MFPLSVLGAYLVACALIVLSPGPDNLLVLSRGLGQGKYAATLSALGAACGIMVHTCAATFGLAVLLRASQTAFWSVKAVGAAYLIGLGIAAIRSRRLISFAPAARVTLHRVFLGGLLTNVLNPKVGLFVLAFIPQFVAAGRGSVAAQMMAFGAVYAVVTIVLFALLGASASRFSAWLAARPRVVSGLNIGAGLAFLGAGLSVLTLKAKA